MENGTAKELVLFQHKRNLMALAKDFFCQLEDIEDGEALNFEKRRKRILDKANDSIREFATQVENLTIDLK